MAALKDVGVAVIGLGIAGKVRVRDLKEMTCGLRLKGVVSRRPVELEGVEAFSFEEALTRPDVNALMICTEPSLHEEYVRRGLESGKHVLVEYPVALSSQIARNMYQLAEDKGVVLQEENIALLTESYKVVKSKASQVELKSAEYALSGSFNGWLENFDRSGLPFITGVSGLQTMMTFFGDLNVVGGKLDKSDDGYTAKAELQTQTGKPISITLTRSKSKDVRREKKSVYQFEDGEVIDTEKIPHAPHSKPGKGLFMRDMENFYAAVVEGKISEDKKQLSIRSLEIAEKIHSFF